MDIVLELIFKFIYISWVEKKNLRNEKQLYLDLLC